MMQGAKTRHGQSTKGVNHLSIYDQCPSKCCACVGQSHPACAQVLSRPKAPAVPFLFSFAQEKGRHSICTGTYIQTPMFANSTGRSCCKLAVDRAHLMQQHCTCTPVTLVSQEAPCLAICSSPLGCAWASAVGKLWHHVKMVLGLPSSADRLRSPSTIKQNTGCTRSALSFHEYSLPSPVAS